jgi:hypothetical protein
MSTSMDTLGHRFVKSAFRAIGLEIIDKRRVVVRLKRPLSHAPR